MRLASQQVATEREQPEHHRVDDHPLGAAVPPGQYIACLPAGSWRAIYIWDAQTQTWKHFFNVSNVPAYVNDPALGGIAQIPQLAGVVLMMNVAVQAPQLKDTPGEVCN